MRRIPFTAVALAAGLVLPLRSAAADRSPDELLDRGEYRKARAAVEAQYRANPNDPEALRRMSRIRMAFGAADEALDLAERAVKLAPNSPAARENLANTCGEMAGQAGGLKQISLGLRFKREAQKALELDPALVDARFGLMQFYLQAPGMAGGDKKRARQMADELVKLDPVQGWIAEARVAAADKDTAGMEEAYRKAVAADPASYAARMTLGNFLAVRHRLDDAEAQWREAQRLDPERVSCYAALAALLANRGRWSELDALLAESESRVPGSLGAYYQAGRQLVVDKREPVRAEGYFRKYLAGEPEGFAPTHAHARWRLAHALEMQGKRAEAIAELQAALRLKPDLDEAKKDLKRLK
jgi:tetratricopeptide (TPR) repeat protein